MSCKVKYNVLGQISEVLDSRGDKSELYNTIASHPFIKSKEEALNVYKNIYTDKVDELSSFTHRTKWGFTDSYKEALQESEEGDKIEVGFYGEEFVSIITIDVNTNPSTVDGFINLQIKNNVLSDKKVVDPDGSFFKAKGNTEQTRAINSAILENELKESVGLGGYKRYAGNKYTISSIKPKSSYEAKSTDSIIATEIAESSMMRTFGSEKTLERPRLSEDELKIRLLNLLSDIGIKVTSISDYVENYNIKNGVDPSAKALADISEKIIAYQGGEISLQDLTEEVSHFIVEGLPQNEVENVLRNIHRTAEWREHSSNYRQIYENEVSENEVDNLVRREVLGKVLANSFINNFSTENRESTESSIVSRLQDLFNGFMDRVRSFFKAEHMTQLEDFTNQVNDLLLRGELGAYVSQENLKGSKFRFYSATTNDNSAINAIRIRTKAVIETLKQQINDLSRTGKDDKVSREQLRRALVSLDNQQTVESITTFLEVAKKQSDYIEESLRKNSKDDYALSQEEVVVFQSLKNDVQPILEELESRASKEEGKDWSTIKDRLENVIGKISKLNGEKLKQESNVINKLVDRVIERHNLDESYRGYIETWVETASSDTSYFHATFGQMIHAQDPLLSLAGVVVQDTMNEGRIKYMKAAKDFQKTLADLGIQEKELDQFFDNGYLVDEIDHKAFENMLIKKRMEVFEEIYNSSNPKEKLSVDELIRRYKSPSNEPKNTLPRLSSEQESELSERVRDIYNELTERPMSEEYYAEKERKYLEAGVQPVTINYLRAISQTRAGIIQPARRPDGTIDRTLLSDSDNKRLDELNRERKVAKNPFTEEGVLKTGLIRNSLQSDPVNNIYHPDYILDKTVNSPSEEAIISANLHAIDSQYMSENKVEKGMPKLFLDYLQKAQEKGQEEALAFLRLNANMSFNSSFWDSFGQNLSLIDRLEDQRDSSDNTSTKIETDKLIHKINLLNERRKNILKIYKNPNNPSETDVQYMDNATKKEVGTLTEALNSLYQDAYRRLDDLENTTEDSDILSEMTTNQAYKDALEDGNITSTAQELEFIEKHVTSSDFNRIVQLKTFLKDYKRGFNDNVPLSLKRYVEANVDLNNLSDESILLSSRDYALTKILPYYKRIAPQGHQALIQRLNSGDISVSDFVDQANENSIDINPNYSYFQQDDSEMANPSFETDYEGGYLQPKKSLFKNKRFDELFAPKKTDGKYDVARDESGRKRYIPSKNNQLYEAYEALKQLQRENLEIIGENGSHNLFKLPQISKTGLQKVTDFAKKASGERVKEMLRDISFYRVDEMERGAEFDGQTLSNSKIVPKYFLRDLESEDDLSDQVFMSYMAFTQQAHLHRARRNNIGDMFALRDKVLTDSRYKDKAAEATRTAKMFDSYMDANFFGITEQSKLVVNFLGREVDLTKLARKFLGFIKFKNLGFSAIVPATSWLTAEVNTKIEQWVKEHTNTRSGEMAFKEYRKLATPAIKELGSLRSKAKLSVLGEFMGIYDLENRYENSSYNKTVRIGQNIGMGLHQAANFPIIPRVMLSVLFDTRVVNGNIINFNDFSRSKKLSNPELSNKQIEADWKQYEEEAIYNYLDVSESTVEWNKSKITSILDREGEELESFLKNKLNGVQSRIEEATSNIDGSISSYRQVAASRHYLLNYFMTHRNWLTIATSRRFKLGDRDSKGRVRHTNLQTGENEEGSWVTAYSFLGNYFKEMSKKNMKGYKETMTEAWSQADEATRRNLRRVGIDFAVLNTMALVGFMLANMADDDDNEDLWALQMSNYLYNRTLNETSSSSMALPLQYLETIESPFVGLNVAYDMASAYKIFDGEVVKNGKYRGMTVGQRQLLKIMPGAKQAREVLTPKEASDTYRFYNQSNFNAVPLYNFLNSEE